MATLTTAARKLLDEAGCNEVADDYIVIGTTDLRVLLSARAVSDLNAQGSDALEQGLISIEEDRD